MATLHSNNTFTQKRPGGKDEPEDLRQLRQEHGNSLSTLKELFSDWTDEDLLYAIQEAGGDLEVAILRISDGHATQWGEVKGKKKTPKPKALPEKQDFRSQRGGFADRGGRGRSDSSRGGRGGATRGVPRPQSGTDRNGRTHKLEGENIAAESATSTATAEKIEGSTEETPSWAEATSADPKTEAAPAWGAAPSATTTNDNTTTDSSSTAPSTITASSTTDSWGAATTSSSSAPAPARKVNTATIPAGSKMSWAKIVKPEPAPQPIPVPAPAPVPTPAAAPASIPAPEPVAPKVAEPVEPVAEPVVEPTPEPTAVVEETPAAPEPEVAEPIEEEVPEPVVAEAVPEPEVAQPAPASPKAAAPVGPPGLKPKATQPRRLNQDAPVVMPSGSAALQSVAVKFGSFALNDETESSEPEQPAAAAATEQPAQPTATQPAAQAAQQPQTQQTQQQTQQSAYGRQPNAPSGASGYQAAPAAGLSPAVTNASYMKQDPAANNYLGQHHHHPGMGHDAMGSPYGSYMPNPANQLGSFGMGPMATLPNDYAALYGTEIQRAMYYDPSSYGPIPVTGGNNYQGRDAKYNQESSTATSTTAASSTGTSQAQQTLQQQQQQQQQAYPNIAGGMPYYPYYYMAPNQFPNYQQSGYGQPFVNKNMYPMYQQQQQQQHSNKPGSANSSPYGNYSSAAGQHHQYSQSGYEDMSGAGIHGMGGLNNDSYGKYGNAGGQNFLGNQQQPATPSTNAGSAKGNTGANNYAGSDKASATGSQASGAAQGASLQGQQPGNANQGQQGYYQQQMFNNYQYPNHGYHPNQHQGQHQGSGRNQQFWSQN